jgi:hypothetical protein
MGNQSSLSATDRTDKLKHFNELQKFIPEKYQIDRVEKISGEDFMEKYYKPQKPLIITNMMEDWPAIQVRKISYLTTRNGR